MKALLRLSDIMVSSQSSLEDDVLFWVTYVPLQLSAGVEFVPLQLPLWAGVEFNVQHPGPDALYHPHGHR